MIGVGLLTKGISVESFIQGLIPLEKLVSAIPKIYNPNPSARGLLFVDPQVSETRRWLANRSCYS